MGWKWGSGVHIYSQLSYLLQTLRSKNYLISVLHRNIKKQEDTQNSTELCMRMTHVVRGSFKTALQIPGHASHCEMVPVSPLDLG